MSIKRQYLGIPFELSWGMGAGEAVCFGQCLSWRWFSPCLVWRGDGCGAGLLLPRASALLQSFPRLRTGEATADSEPSVGWHSLCNTLWERSPPSLWVFPREKIGPPAPLPLSLWRDSLPAAGGTSPGWPSPGYHTVPMRTGGN